ncbi:MAG: hypothetical protein JNL24_00560 [Bacteroidia bacterium]|nr:hypothetical protein [Bacteroidia bacterium]
MRLQVGRCYILTSNGTVKKFRVVKNISNKKIYIRYCKTQIEEEFFTETALGGFDGYPSIEEFDCMNCDGSESV